MTRSRVALLVACYDDGATIRETIESLRAEPETELVVVDDGSTERATHEALAALKRDGVRVLHQENQGPSAAWMHGLRSTTARYAMPFSSDDVLLSGAVKDLADALDADPQSGFAWGDMETFGLTAAYRPSVPELCPWLVTYTNCIPAYALFRRTTLLEVGGWRRTDAPEDWDLWMRLAALNIRGIYVAQPIFRCRRDGGGRFRRRGSHFEPFYAELQDHNPQLFQNRAANRATSPAPSVLKVLIPVVERLPFVPRLKKIQLSETLTLLFWSAGVSRTAKIVVQGAAFRMRLLSRRYLAAGEGNA
jgi:glycosyltransferase involved in cell wall biosynthesis